MILSDNLRGALLAVCAFGLFSVADTIVKYESQSLPVAAVTVMITSTATLLIALYGFGIGRGRALVPVMPAFTLGRGALLATETAIIYYAFTIVPLADVYVLTFLTPIFVSLIAIVALGERPSPLVAVGVVLGFVGVLVAFRPGDMGFGLGHFAAAGSALIFAVTLVMIRIAPPRESDLALVICPMIILAIGSGTLTVLTTGFPALSIRDLALVLLAGFCLFSGNLLIVRAYRVGAASFVAPFQYCLIFWGAFNGWLVFGESVELFTWIGAAIIIVAGLIVLRSDRTNA
ncbi:DMT family transporter [Pleomorphomonas sp. JP5]|uniref:DMT family transporter n=1 Tax=Pleomorphomonas sp. JP5 TaxID=2942998 RepID=UPI002044B944|nr:EamA family transporter [Pleomorphomonas sp. JP5]MCM5560107.1 DMT family transporter [Pleomorphomonas sp. JP5]